MFRYQQIRIGMVNLYSGRMLRLCPGGYNRIAQESVRKTEKKNADREALIRTVEHVIDYRDC